MNYADLGKPLDRLTRRAATIRDNSLSQVKQRQLSEVLRTYATWSARHFLTLALFCGHVHSLLRRHIGDPSWRLNGLQL
jgi:hypothetical protein